MMNNEKNINKGYGGYLIYVLFAFVSVVFLMAFSILTSPLYKYGGGDSGIFIMMARYFLEGMTPYVDFFDHKGPVIIFIEAIGLKLSSDNRFGVFILQSINLTIVQILIYKCSRLFLSAKDGVIVVIFSLLVFSLTIDQGNLTEEYSLPFLFISLYFTLKYILSKTPAISTLHMFVMGVSAAVLFWLRPTNGGIICACVLFLFIESLRTKDYRGLIKVVFSTLTGFLVVSLIIVAYFIKIDAFDEMIYAAFTFNLKYMSSIDFLYKNPLPLHLTKTWLSLVVLGVGCVLYYIRKRNIGLLLLAVLMFVINVVTTIFMGPGFYHYMTLNIPCLVLGTVFIISVINEQYSQRKKLVSFGGIIVAVLLVAYIYISFYRNRERLNDSEYISLLNEVVANIPVDEQNSVYGYAVDVKFWYYTDLKPYMRYFIMQERHSMHDESVITEINNRMESAPPKWVATQAEAVASDHINKRFFEIVISRYDLRYKNSMFELYRLKDKDDDVIE